MTETEITILKSKLEEAEAKLRACHTMNHSLDEGCKKADKEILGLEAENARLRQSLKWAVGQIKWEICEIPDPWDEDNSWLVCVYCKPNPIHGDPHDGHKPDCPYALARKLAEGGE